jgi:hypothetical protein
VHRYKLRTADSVDDWATDIGRPVYEGPSSVCLGAGGDTRFLLRNGPARLAIRDGDGLSRSAPHPTFRFPIRDVLWLTLLIAILCAALIARWKKEDAQKEARMKEDLRELFPELTDAEPNP